MIGRDESAYEAKEKRQGRAKTIVIWMIIVMLLASGAAIGVNWWFNRTDKAELPSESITTRPDEKQEEITASDPEETLPAVKPVEEPDYQPAVPTSELPVLYQNPELPAGCEATAVAMLLQAYGYTVSKEAVADALPKSTFEVKDGRTYAAHPNEAYVGTPYSSSGFGVLAKAAAETAQKLIDAAGGTHKAVAITGASEEALLAYLDDGIPVCVWATMWMSPLVYSGEWYLKDGDNYTDELYVWPGGEHCLVLVAYNESTVTVHDPLGGVVTYNREIFFQRYQEVGQYALILEEPVVEHQGYNGKSDLME